MGQADLIVLMPSILGVGIGDLVSDEATSIWMVCGAVLLLAIHFLKELLDLLLKFRSFGEKTGRESRRSFVVLLVVSAVGLAVLQLALQKVTAAQGLFGGATSLYSKQVSTAPSVTSPLVLTNASIKANRPGQSYWDEKSSRTALRVSQPRHERLELPEFFGGGPAAWSHVEASSKQSVTDQGGLEFELLTTMSLGGRCGPNGSNTGGEGRVAITATFGLILPVGGKREVEVGLSTSIEGLAGVPSSQIGDCIMSVTGLDGLEKEHMVPFEQGGRWTLPEMDPGVYVVTVSAPLLQRGCFGAGAGTVSQGTGTMSVTVHASDVL